MSGACNLGTVSPDKCLPGGAFILVEKVLGATAKLDEAFVNLFLNIKRENGYPESQIDRKRMSLEGVLVPVTARWNEEHLHRRGSRRSIASGGT